MSDDDVMPAWRPHDLRRTGAGVYSLYRYLPEKLGALALWRDYLRSILATKIAEVPERTRSSGETLKKALQIGKTDR